MSESNTAAWLEQINESFEDAVTSGDWATADVLMIEVKEEGFENEWKTMRHRYNHERFEEQ